MEERYFEWLCNLVRCEPEYSHLMSVLPSIEFIFINPLDENREIDGYDLRYRFAHENDILNIDDHLTNPCSMLEMMVALADRCETHIMHDDELGDRTHIWFFYMIENMGLRYMTNDQIDEEVVYDTVNRVLDRDYGPHGEGGLFTVRNPREDLRDTEIWYQMCWWLNELEG